MTDARGVVSVVVPAYNAERWIEETLRSVLVQEHRALEAIVVDDGSTDATAEVARRTAGDDPRVRVLAFSNGGLSCARNRGLAAARGELVAFLDADDLWHPAKLRLQCERLGTRRRTVVLCGVRRFTDEDGGRRWLHETPVPALRDGEGRVRDVLGLRNDQMVVFNTALFRTAELRTLGGFREGLVSAEDWELWLRASRDHAMLAVDAPLHFYRKHAQSLTRTTPLAAVLELQLSLVARDRDAGLIDRAGAQRVEREKLLEFASAALWRGERALAARLVARGLVRHGGLRSHAYCRHACRIAGRAVVEQAASGASRA